MRALRIEGTDKTPQVILDPDKNVFELKGKSIPTDAEAFFGPVLEWFDEFAKRPKSKITLVFMLDFFNISSSKRLLFMLYKLNEILEKGGQSKVQWYYSEHDDDMFEVGQDYAFMVKVPFEFYCLERDVRAGVLNVA